MEYIKVKVEIVPLESISELLGGDLFKEIESKVDLELLLNKLSPQEKKIATIFSEGYNYTEIGLRLKLSPQKVRRIMKKIAKKTL